MAISIASAAAKKRDIEIEIVRTGSRGLYWAEPMVEVATPAGRVAYGPVSSDDVDDLLNAGFLDGKSGHRQKPREGKLLVIGESRGITANPTFLCDFGQCHRYSCAQRAGACAKGGQHGGKHSVISAWNR